MNLWPTLRIIVYMRRLDKRLASMEALLTRHVAAMETLVSLQQEKRQEETSIRHPKKMIFGQFNREEYEKERQRKLLETPDAF